MFSYLSSGGHLLQAVERQGVDVEHRVRASAPALGEGAGVDAERPAHVLDEGGELGGEEEDWWGGEGRGEVEKEYE